MVLCLIYNCKVIFFQFSSQVIGYSQSAGNVNRRFFLKVQLLFECRKESELLQDTGNERHAEKLFFYFQAGTYLGQPETASEILI